MTSHLHRVLSAGQSRGALIGAPQPMPDVTPEHAMAREITKNAIALNPFYIAFGPYLVEYRDRDNKAKAGYRAREMVDIGAVGTLHMVQSWIKIGGKNGMDPSDVHAMLDPAGNPRMTIQSALGQLMRQGVRIGFVFDGDNYEPENGNQPSAPFSVIIKELISRGHVVVAIKNADDAYYAEEAVYVRAQLHGSRNFVEKWMPFAEMHPTTFLMAVMPSHTLKEDVSEKANAFIYWGSTYQGLKKDYRYRPNGDDTQGWKEIQGLQQNPSMITKTLGRNRDTFTAVRGPVVAL